MKNQSIRIWIVFVSIVCSLTAFFFWKKIEQEPSAPSDQALPLNQPGVQQSSPRIKYPVASPGKANSNVAGSSEKTSEPLPKLEESDLTLEQKSTDFFGTANFSDVIIYENFIRHFVISIEDATGRQIPADFSPIKAAEGALVVTTLDGHLVLSEQNYKRYKPYIELAQAADLKKIVSYYVQIYPLFQSIYEDLGKQGYFNDRFIEVIDNLLATPKIEEPIRLTHPSIHYEFEDPNLESLSTIQKALLRMGPRNSEILKAKFKKLREMLTHLD